VLLPDERGCLPGLMVVAEPHEGGGCRAADERGCIVAQVPEQQGQRDFPPLAGARRAVSSTKRSTPAPGRTRR
jgi:hypothetical protein